MAASHLLLDIEDQQSAEAQLQFQEFTASDARGGAAELDVKNTQTLLFNHSPDTPGSDPEGDTNADDKKPTSSFWTFDYYQQFFDVNTDQVLDRILWSMIPRPGVSFLQHHIKSKPDLYGPVWICMTLVFTIAISGNIANYLQTAEKNNYHWKYDFHTVTFAATAIFCYAWLVPTLLWGTLRWIGSEMKLTFLELICVYGYSLAIYVPVSVLWVIQIAWLQWILVAVGAALSGSVLLMTTWPAIEGKHRCVIVVILLALHLLLATGFMLSIFHVPPLDIPTIAPITEHLVVGVSNKTTG